MIELAIVVVIMGIIAAIALPRMSSAADRAASNSVVYDQSAFQGAIDLYREEHEGVLPHVGAANVKEFVLRLLGHSDVDGTVDPSGIYGPYLHAIPNNKVNGLSTIRKDGAAAGANTHGWRYDSTTGVIEPDHSGTGYTVRTKPLIDGDATVSDVLDAIKVGG